MASFRYRALGTAGRLQSGLVEAADQPGALARLRAMGVTPVDAIEVTGAAAGAKGLDGAGRKALVTALGELAVLLEAGLPLDRALLVCFENITAPTVRAAFGTLLAKVKQGAPLSRAMAEEPKLFPPVATAMAEAGEADGRLAPSLARLAEALDRAEALRETIVGSLTYPAMLLSVASGVVIMMLIVVVPQFEGLFGDNLDRLPLATRLAVTASHGLKDYGLTAVGLIVAIGFLLRFQLQRPQTRQAFDRLVLRVPLLGSLIRNGQTAGFARTLGSLVDGGVPLPTALSISRRSLSNSHMAEAVEQVAARLKQGGGLTAPLAATGVFPPIALSFLKVGEETARLGPMLLRLADVLDRSVRLSVQQMLAILTPTVTVVMGITVATLIASIMSAILGLNDLALAP